MARHGKHLSLQCLSIGLSLKLVLISGLVTGVQAQSALAQPDKATLNSFVTVTFQPRGRGKPRDTAGGASRDGGICPVDSAPMSSSVTLLSPISDEGLTLAEHPTFFIYSPQTSAQKALFVLKDEKEDYLYQKTISIPRTAGIFSFKLPADAPAMEVGKNYKWSFVMMCGEAIRPDSPGVEGQIRRVALDAALTNQLKSLSPLERAALYGKNGIWYDTLTSLAEQRRSQPQDTTLAATWENLLKSVGLEAIATKPLLP
jgi:hypothetical protein